MNPVARWAGKTVCPYCSEAHDRPACHDLGGDDFLLICPRTGKLYGIDGQAAGAEAPPAKPRVYCDVDGRQFFVCDGISQGTSYAVYTYKRAWTLQRVRSPYLPLCKTRDEAQRMLDAWAKKRGLREVDPHERIAAWRRV